MKTVSSEKLRTALHRIALNIYGDTCAQVIAGEALDAVDIEETAQPDTAALQARIAESYKQGHGSQIPLIECLQSEIKELEAQLAAQAGQEKTYPACNGNNCGTTDGKSHSQECFAEHDACVSTGSNLLDTAGNRNPEYRYAGYSGEPCGKSASEDQRKAWKEGCDAALRPPASPARAGQEPYGWLLRIKPSSLFAFVIGPNNPWKENAGAIPLYASPSNSRAIAQSALEAAAQVCDSVNNHDNPMTASDCADAIRAIDPQTILDVMTK